MDLTDDFIGLAVLGGVLVIGVLAVRTIHGLPGGLDASKLAPEAQAVVQQNIPLLQGLPTGATAQDPGTAVQTGFNIIANSGLDGVHQAIATGYFLNAVATDQSNPVATADNAVRFASNNQGRYGPAA